MHDVSGQPKVTDLDNFALREKDVPGCEIPMHTLSKRRCCCHLFAAAHLAPTTTGYFCVSFSASFIFNTVSFSFIKLKLYASRAVGKKAMTAGIFRDNNYEVGRVASGCNLSRLGNSSSYFAAAILVVWPLS